MLLTFVHLGGLYQMNVVQPFLYQSLDHMICQQLLRFLSIPAKVIKANRIILKLLEYLHLLLNDKLNYSIMLQAFAHSIDLFLVSLVEVDLYFPWRCSKGITIIRNWELSPDKGCFYGTFVNKQLTLEQLLWITISLHGVFF